MSALKKLRHIFNRAVGNTPAIIAAGALSLGLGWNVMNSTEVHHSTTPPVANVQMHDAAVDELRTMAADILAQQERINFNARTLQNAQSNIGANEGASLEQQMADLQNARDRQIADEQAQDQRLHDFRKTVWFNASISEKEADNLYTQLFYAAQDKGYGNITGFFSPMTDALTFRDETVADANLPQDPAQVSNQAGQNVLEQARAADEVNDGKEMRNGAGAALGGGLFSLGLIWLAFAGRRREEEEADRLEQEREKEREIAREEARRARKPTPEPAPEQNNETPAEERKPSSPGKFSL